MKINVEEEIKNIDKWISETFTSAYIEKTVHKLVSVVSHMWVAHHSDYVVAFLYNYFTVGVHNYESFTSVVSLRCEDPDTNGFIMKEFETKTFEEMKPLIIDYLEDNKDKVEPYPDDDETLISHIDFREGLNNIEATKFNDNSKSLAEQLMIEIIAETGDE